MKHSKAILATLLAVAVSSPAFAVTEFLTSFNEPSSDIADTADIVTSVLLQAGVDTDGDGNDEIVYARLVGGATQQAQLFIYENSGNNTYTLAFSNNFATKGTLVNGSLGGLVVANADATAGTEIYLFASGPTALAGNSLFVVYSTGPNTWATTAVAPPVTAMTAGNANTSGTATEWTSAVAGDPDNDGAVELIATDDVTDGTFIFEVSGSWPSATLSATEPNTMFRSTAAPAPGPAAAAGQLGGSKYNVFLADMNNDGRQDILSSSWNSMEFGIWEGTAADTFTRSFINLAVSSLDQPPMGYTTTAANFDGSGFPTAYAGNSRTGDIFAWIGADPISTMSTLTTGSFGFGGGAGGLALTGAGAGNTFAQHPLQSLRAADVDDDNNGELLLALNLELSAPLVGGEVVIYEYNGTGADNVVANFTTHRGATTNLVTTERAAQAVGGTVSAILDMDNDGIAEIVVATPGATSSAIYVFEIDPFAHVSDWKNHN